MKDLRAQLNEAFTARFGESWSRRWTCKTRDEFWHPMLERYPREAVEKAISHFVTESKIEYCPSPAQFDDQCKVYAGENYRDRVEREWEGLQAELEGRSECQREIDRKAGEDAFAELRRQGVLK